MFRLTNDTKRPIRVLSATARTPCCSAIQAVPRSIPAGGRSDVAVVFRPGHQTGPKAVRFEIATDSDDRPIWTLVLQAEVFAEWDLAPAGARVGSTKIGQSSTENWRMACRRMASGGLSLPDAVEASGPIKPKFVGPASERTISGGLIESTRDIEVALPSVSKPGSQQGELVLRWPDGRTKAHVIRWTVVPSVRLAPSSIVIDSSGEPAEWPVTLISDDREFRVTRVAGSLLSEPLQARPESSRTHRLSLRLDPSRATSGAVSRILIETDHPEQRELTLTVVVTPPAQGI